MAMAIESNYQFRPFFFGGLIFFVVACMLHGYGIEFYVVSCTWCDKYCLGEVIG